MDRFERGSEQVKAKRMKRQAYKLTFCLAINQEILDLLEEAADFDDLPLSTWARRHLMRAAKAELAARDDSPTKTDSPQGASSPPLCD